MKIDGYLKEYKLKSKLSMTIVIQKQIKWVVSVALVINVHLKYG